jgi:hypothetical protein
VGLFNDLMALKVGLKNLNDPIDTTTSRGRAGSSLPGHFGRDTESHFCLTDSHA